MPVKESDPRPIRTWLPIILVARTTLNISYRIIYPFLPSIARGLGISLTEAGLLVTLRQAAGLAGPFLGPVADRSNRRSVMELALLLFTLASLLVAGVGTLPAAAIAFVVYGLAKILYDPTMHAYIGDTVPYPGRGRIIGIAEMAWSAAWLIGVPASGFLIERLGWRAPWAILIGLGLFSVVLTRIGLPLGRRPVATLGNTRPVAALIATWRDLLRQRRVVVLFLVCLLITIASEAPFIVYGAWLETTFGLSLSTLGLASMVVGVAEAVAELGTALLTDRLGKRRSVVIGLFGLVASLLLLPLLTRLGLAAALSGVVLITLSFEFGIVSLLPLATELMPEARASLMSLAMTAFGLGRILGAVAGGLLWQWQGGTIAINAWVGAACALLAAVLMLRGMVEPK
jgi:predicted MFS family arabinose efflux permease